jgi:hypothetical protein
MNPISTGIASTRIARAGINSVGADIWNAGVMIITNIGKHQSSKEYIRDGHYRVLILLSTSVEFLIDRTI